MAGVDCGLGTWDWHRDYDLDLTWDVGVGTGAGMGVGWRGRVVGVDGRHGSSQMPGPGQAAKPSLMEAHPWTS